jgi:hypothetical protein
MADIAHRYEVAACTLEVQAQGTGFVMDLSDPEQTHLRLAFPAWLVNQLLRALPHIDAALQQRDGLATASLVAHPVQDWGLEPLGEDQGHALWLRDNRHVEAAFHLAPDDLARLHGQIGEALAARAPREAGADGGWQAPRPAQ